MRPRRKAKRGLTSAAEPGFVILRGMPDAAPADPYLHDLYDSLHDSPVQRKFRRLRPWPVGVVFIQWPDMSMDDIREHFRLMKRLGFTCLKQCQVNEETDQKAVMHMALDEGIVPFWYDDAGVEDPTPELLKRLGVGPAAEGAALREDPKWKAFVERSHRERIDRGTGMLSMTAAGPAPGVPSTIPRFEYALPDTDELREAFTGWLTDKYGTLEALRDAWNFAHAMVPLPQEEWNTWDDVRAGVIALVNKERREYRRMCDVLRFKGDMHLATLRHRRDQSLEEDPTAPIRAGGEMSLFLPFAMWGVDMEGIADVMTDAGSFYPSMHPGWHFEEVNFELMRPVYMQSSLAADWFKGGWAATWESTGGPQILSGGNAPFVPGVRGEVPGFTIEEGEITQMMLSWIAAGFRGFGQWCWNARSFGWEGGEYALLDRNRRECGRTRAAGAIGAACQGLRDELWGCRKEPMVGVFQDFEGESFWAALSLTGRDMFRTFGQRARVGAARALINANIPWEHVTARDLRAGLADRYKSIFLPACLALDTKLVEDVLIPYVQRGGRVVLDAPGGWFDYGGRVLQTLPGSPFERLFGVTVRDYHYSREDTAMGRSWKFDMPGWEEGIDTDEENSSVSIEGFVLSLDPTTAEVLATFDDGQPSHTEHRLGEGTACIMGYSASLLCNNGYEHPWFEELLVAMAVGTHDPGFDVDADVVVYRLAGHGPEAPADHYFLLNDHSTPTQVTLDTYGYSYTAASDPITGKNLKLGKPIQIEAHSGRWVRMRK